MSALYRQARPSTFDEMVGQEHVKEVLLNAIKLGKLSQAYLFSGPRGVGKTSSARLIAQAVNCNSQPKPCGVCEGCRLVREARHPDVLEIDAASHNSVEDVRDLRDTILLAPLLSQHKVVILDEAHMMSKSAFNALLKTLEEPPPHVIFIFATTEPERMPPTILSRTQHFRFKRLSESEIAQKLDRILQSLGRQAEPAALELVARMADGAMRDAESLLDRLLTLDGPLSLRMAEASLGLPPQEHLWALAETLEQGHIKPAIEQAQSLYTQGFSARTLAQGLLEALRAGLYAQMGLGLGPSLQSPSERLVAAMTALDEAMERLLKRSDFLALELALLSAFQALHTNPLTAAAPAAAFSPALSNTPSKPSVPDFNPSPNKPLRQETQASANTSPNPVLDLAQQWRAVLAALKQNVRAFAREASPRFESDRLDLVFPERASFHFQQSQKHQEAIQAAVNEVLGDYRVSLVLQGEKKKVTPEPSPPSALLTPKASAILTTVNPPNDAPPVFPVAVNEPVAPTPTEPVASTPTEPPPPSSPPTQAVVSNSSTPSSQANPIADEEPPWPTHDGFSEAPDAPHGEIGNDADAQSTPSAASDPAKLLADPRMQKLLKMFGGRVRKLQREAAPEIPEELPVDSETPEE